MGKKKRNQEKRADRTATMLRDEAALRDRLDSLLKAGNEMAERVHYDKLMEQADRGSALAQEISAGIKEGIDLLGHCYCENHVLSRECERLEGELDSLEGRPVRSSPFEEVDLSAVTPEQASAIRLVMALDASPAPAEVDQARAGEALVRVSAHLKQMHEKLASPMGRNAPVASHHRRERAARLDFTAGSRYDLGSAPQARPPHRARPGRVAAVC